ncbi:hypothetical protein [Tenuibacillus multivorans]|uniref:Uncharacterized protein n=1 Tax=Tenuibacillus multivorans TaxID=237069 RepID=A0A1H0AYF8_9BACI|nr:hypothetical protein [Tenuibacillus multivorans]GEL77621.1 hypothetical protein TMU01_18560 [Tenuibacillus multivorans]SDN38246.1 hypothetical protein SAMN05216498_2127 [Tenuibacillus multivorans]
MKHYDDSLDRRLKRLNEEVNLTEDEKENILDSIHYNINHKHMKSNNIFNKPFVFAISSIAITLFFVVSLLLQQDSDIGTSNLQVTGKYNINSDEYTKEERIQLIKNYKIGVNRKDQINLGKGTNIPHSVGIMNRFDIGADDNYQFGRTQNVDAEALKNGGLDVQVFIESAGGDLPLSLKAFYYREDERQLYFFVNTGEAVYEYPIDEALYGENRDLFLLEKLKHELEVGMSKEEVIQNLGPYDQDFHSSPVDRKFWRYDVEPNKGDPYTKYYRFVDFSGIANNMLNMQVFVRWNGDSAESFSAVYFDETSQSVRQYHMSEGARLTEAIFNNEDNQHIHVGDFIYPVPSVNHITSQEKPYDTQQFLSVDELHAQTYDQTLNKAVSTFKNYRPGDTIYFEETIQSIIYHEAENKTEFVLSEDTSMEFAGDLREQYNEGDRLRLRFKVIPQSADGIYVTYDYAYHFYQHDESPQIEDYLVE